jgi:hypothetical protein
VTVSLKKFYPQINNKYQYQRYNPLKRIVFDVIETKNPATLGLNLERVTRGEEETRRVSVPDSQDRL